MTRLKAFVSNPTVKVADPDLPYVALEHIESGTGRLLYGVSLEGKDADDSVEHVPGDVRFGKLRPYLSKSFLATEPGAGSGELLVLRPGAEINCRFLWYLTLTRTFADWAVATSYGVKMPRTSWAAIGAFEFAPPPLAEQAQITSFLDEETSRIDELIAEQLLLLRLLAEHWDSLLDEAIWGITDDVEVMPLAGLIDAARPLTYGVVLAGDHVEDGIPLVEAGSILNGRFRTEPPKRTSRDIERDFKRSRVRPGDILMAIRGTVGRVAIATPEMSGWNVTRDVALIAPHPSRVSASWLLLALWSPRAQAMLSLGSSGSAIKGINLAALGKLRLPVPHMTVQLARVGDVEGVRSRVETIIAEVNSQVALLREHRQALITAAVTGGLDAVRKMA